MDMGLLFGAAVEDKCGLAYPDVLLVEIDRSVDLGLTSARFHTSLPTLDCARRGMGPVWAKDRYTLLDVGPGEHLSNDGYCCMTRHHQ